MEQLNEDLETWVQMEFCQSDSYLLKEKRISFNRKHRRLDNLLIILGENKNLYWPAIFTLLRNKTQLLSEMPFLKKYPKRFLGKLLRYGCSDSHLVRRIFKVYACWLWRIWVGDISFMDSSVKSRIVEVADRGHICPPLGGGYRNDLCCFSDVQMIELALYRTDVKFLAALLRFGFCDIPRQTTRCEYLIAGHDLMKFWLARIALGYWSNLDLIMIQNSSINGGDMGNGKQRGFRRILFIIRALKIVVIARTKLPSMRLEWQPSVEDSVQCMKLYFRVTLEPFISKEDILDFLRLYLGNFSDAFMESLCQDYENLFPEESSTPYGPRSLKHLCRHRFRRHVREKNGVLPELVGGLRLPAAIARYLLCEC